MSLPGPHQPSPASVARARQLSERNLTPEEFDAWVRAPLSEEERENTASLIRWFLRRYPTPADRLRYAREAYARWRRSLP
jgi:hypothetical protein